MSTNKSTNVLPNIKKSLIEIKQTIMINIVKMLIERNILFEKNKKNYFDYVTENTKKGEENFKIKSDVDENDIYHIKIVSEKMLSRKPHISKIIDFSSKNKYIIISLDDKSFKLLKDVEKLPNIETFNYQELLINVTDHFLVPEHRILNKEDAEQILEQYMCTKKTMPRMLKTDRIARHFNMKVGDMVEIKRISESCGHTLFYRVVVNPVV